MVYDRRIDAAKRYAAAERSDPFAFRRAMTHLQNNVAGFFDGNGKETFYNADEFVENRSLPDGREYQVTVYKNIVRP